MISVIFVNVCGNRLIEPVAAGEISQAADLQEAG
jgi:hypothetical protein